jgi:hypothetical protein
MLFSIFSSNSGNYFKIGKDNLNIEPIKVLFYAYLFQVNINF